MRKWFLLFVAIWIAGLIAPQHSHTQAQIDERLVLQQQIAGRGVVESMVWSPGGDILATNAYDGVRLYNATTLEDVTSLDGAGGYVSKIAWHPSGPWIAGTIGLDPKIGSRVAYDDVAVLVWNSESNLAPMRLRLPTDEVVVDLPNNQPISNAIVNISDLVWNPTNTQLAAVSQVQFFTLITIWNVETGVLVGFFTLDPFEGGELVMVWSPEGDQLAVGQFNSRTDDKLAIWRADTEPQVLELQNSISALSWTTEGLILSGDDVQLTVDPNTLTVNSERLSTNPILSPDGRYVYDNRGNELAILNAADMSVVDTLTTGSQSRFGPRFDEIFWRDDNSLMALVVRRDPQIVVWDGVTQAPRFSYQLATSTVTEWILTPDADAAIVADFSGKLTRLNLTAGDVEAVRRVDTRNIQALAPSPDGSRLAFVQAGDDTLVVVDLIDQREVFSASAGNDFQWMSAVAWHPDGNTLATSTIAVGDEQIAVDADQMTVRWWDTTTWELQAEQYIDSFSADAMTGLRWSASGEYLAGSSISNMSGRSYVYVWSGQERLLTLPIVSRHFGWLGGTKMLIGGPLGNPQAVESWAVLIQLDVAELFNRNLGEMRIEDIASLGIYPVQGENTSQIINLAVNPTNPDMVALHVGSSIQIYQLSSASVLATIPIESRGLYAPMAWRADGQFLAIEQIVVTENSSAEILVQVWSVAGDGSVSWFAERTDHSFSPTGIFAIAWVSPTQLASAGGYGDVIVWEFSDAE